MPIQPVETSPTERSLMIVPPVMGWNTTDPKSNMDSSYAIELENYFPKDGAVELRNGYRKHVKIAVNDTKITHLDELINNSGTRFFIGFAGTLTGTPYNVTSAGAGTALTGGLSTGSSLNFTVNYRGRLFCKGFASGAGTDIFYTDGTAATLAAFTGPGGDDKALWRLATYKNRLYALATADASMWYSEYEAITGAMTQYDFQSVLTLGGVPWFIGTFSMTAGDILQEYFCVISQQGEVLLYEGSYPASVSWNLKGRYFIAAPVGRKSFFNWGSDVLVITYEGLVSLRDVIGAGGSRYSYLSDKIASAFRDFVEDSTSKDFIQGIVYAKGQYLLVHAFSTNEFAQFVMNTQTKAWTKFTGQTALCWSLFNNDIYFGSEHDAVVGPVVDGGYVGKADTGAFDENLNVGLEPNARVIKVRHAFNYFGSPETKKIFMSAQPIMYQSEGMSITANMDVDFSNTTATATEGPDTSKGTSYQFYNPTIALTNDNNYYGTAGSFRIDGTVTTKRFRLEATKITWSEG